MTGERWSKTFSLALIGVASFSSLLPIVLAVMNALKTTVEINANPLAPPTRFHWENFTSAWQNAALGPRLLHSAEVASLTILMVCATAAPCAYVLARKQGRGWRILTFYFMASITVPVQAGEPLLGTWQSVVLVDLNRDNPRRSVRLTFLDG